MNLKHSTHGISLYGTLLAVILAAGWLLPNHYPPWGSFHSNAWIAATLLIIAFRALAARHALAISPVPCLVASLALVPWIQHAAGVVPLATEAIMASSYLLGLAAAIALGEHWERTAPGNSSAMVLGAAAIASLICVGLQIYQWLGLARSPALVDIWVYPSDGHRPYANLGQPNQLASLQLWGLLGAAWAWRKGWIRAALAIALAGFMLLGVALTESRTALLTLTAGVAVLSLARFKFLDRRVIRAVLGLYLFYLAALFGLAPLGALLGNDVPLTVFERSAGELRMAIWRMALDAASQRPWAGFGWGRASEGLLHVYPDYPQLANRFMADSHNLALDFALWVGWPLALLLVAVSAWWLWRTVQAVTDTEQFLTVAAIGVMVLHAMVELPLHHGYFLWPFGVLAGAASARLRWPRLATVSRRTALAGMVALCTLAGTLATDYFKVEQSFAELRFQLLRIGTGHDERPPNTVLLDAWPQFIVMARATPRAGMSAAQIRHWEELLMFNVSPRAFRHVVGALALNGQADRARYWADRSCTVLHPVTCREMLGEWTSRLQSVDSGGSAAATAGTAQDDRPADAGARRDGG